MANKSSHISDKENSQPSVVSKTKDETHQAQLSMKMHSLTSNQLEQWFANIERENKPSKNTNSYLSTQFLSRFGLKNPQEVLEFLNSLEGKKTLSMIRSQELMNIDSLNQYQAEKYREEAFIRQRLLLFLLMALITKDKEHTKHVSEIIQQQIEHILNETKHSESKQNQQAITTQILDANINVYSSIIKALDEQLEELDQNLVEVEEELIAIEEEALQMAQQDANINHHLDQLNAYLQLPLFHNQSMVNYVDHINKQIASLTTQLSALKVQHAVKNTTSSNIVGTQEIDVNTRRKIRMMEQQLAFHHAQLKQPSQNGEQVFQQLIEQVRARLNEQQCLCESQPAMTHYKHELQGLRVEERGLCHALQVLRKEKILLNAQLEQVDDFSQAHFIIDSKS